MSTKMNFGPEWMRSAPALNRLGGGGGLEANGGAGAGDQQLGDPDGRQAAGDGAATAGGGTRRYTHERMLELFTGKESMESFSGSEHVFSEQALAPVSLVELSSKEAELFSGPVNSSAAKRYSNVHQQQAQAASRQHQHQQAAHGRNGSAQRAGGVSNNAWAKLRDPSSRGAGGTGLHYDSAGAADSPAAPFGAADLEPGDDAPSMWASQPIVRDSVGTFGSDGVFRMGGDDDDQLEPPPAASHYSSRTASPAGGGPRSAAAAGVPRSRPMLRSPQSRVPGVAADGGAWRDLAGGPPTAAAHQRRLLEQAEQAKWWYRDPQGSVQGPFSAAHMQDWLAGGYFPTDLQVCFEGGPGFESLGAMVARLGGPQNAFVCAVLAFAAQGHPSLSGVSTPATPAAMSRAPSSIQLGPLPGGPLPGGTPARSAAATPVRSGFNQPVPSAATSAGLAQPSAYADPAAPGPAPSAVQISKLLSDQLFVVTAVGERQRVIARLQEQLQQSLAKLVQDLTQEVNAVHYRAQLDHAPVQNDALVALQLHAQASEERLRHDFAQLVQLHAAEIAQLERQMDPVIKNIVVQSGAEFALNFITQQLQELSMLAATERSAPLPNSALPAADQAPAADPPAESVGGDHSLQAHSQPPASATEPEAAAMATSEPIASAAAEEIVALASDLEQAKVTAAVASDADAASSAAGAALPKDSAAAKAPSSPARPKSSRGRSQPKSSEPAAAKASSAREARKPSSKAAAAVVSEPAPSPAPTAAGSSGNKDSAKAPAPSMATPAPWSGGIGANASQPKKSLLQIQQEEEEALRKRQQADEQQRSQAAVSRNFGVSYADRLGGAASVAPRSLAAIMAEQSKEPAQSNTAAAPAPAPAPTPAPAADAASSGSVATIWSAIRPLTTPPAPPAAQSSGPAWGGIGAPVPASDASGLLAAKPASSGKPPAKLAASGSGSNGSGPALPSLAFLEWCYSRLSSLRGIDVCKFIEMLLTFPLKAPESTLEIISEQVYAYSTTLNGRAFAEDFVARRNKDHAAVRNGSAKTAPVNWAQLLSSSSKTAALGAGSSGFSSAAPASVSSNSANGLATRGRGSSTGTSSFQVVGKKGKK
ncbi:kinesin-like protein [Coemansia thaxteri]|nr:kinesin-like protein [Coemansia thaxteri]